MMPPRKRPGQPIRPAPPSPPHDPAGPGANGAGDEGAPRREVGSSPGFAQPEATPDPTTFRIKHLPDKEAYREIHELNREHKIFPMRFPAPRGGIEPRLTFE